MELLNIEEHKEELTMEQKKGIIYWKLAIWKLISGNVIIIINGFIGATAAVKWDSMQSSEKFLIAITILVNVIKQSDAFLDQTIARLMQGKPLVELPKINGNGTNGNGGDTTIMTKTDTTTVITKDETKSIPTKI